MKPHEFAGTIPGMGISRVALLPQFAAPPAPRPVDAHNVTLRLATSADEPFLWEMLAEAARLEENAGDIAAVRLRPDLALYVEGWGRGGDVGVVAEIDGCLVGAAWMRLFDDARHGYGYLRADVGELAIAVVPDRRYCRVGTLLLHELIAHARVRHHGVSLSVRRDNVVARRLYDHFGFREVAADIERNGGRALTMFLELHGG